MGLKGSMLDSAVGQPELAAGVAVGSGQTRAEPGSLRGSTAKTADWLAFGSGLERVAAGQSGGLLTDVGQDCSTPQR